MGAVKGHRKFEKKMEYYGGMVEDARKTTHESAFCYYAHEIYRIWEKEGKYALKQYLIDEIGCSAEHATQISNLYKPEHPPIDTCPLGEMQGWRPETIFPSLSVQLPAKVNGGEWPKNLLAFCLQRKILGPQVFDFQLIGDGEGQNNKILFPHTPKGPDGNTLPFVLSALEAVEFGELPAHVLKKSEVLINALGPVGMDFAKMLLDARMEFPPQAVLRGVIDTLQRGLNGETIILFGGFCPDYSYKESDKKDVKYEYTFTSLNDGIGLVASQIARVLPFFAQFLQKHGIAYKMHFAIGDFEAHSPLTRQIVGNISYEDFIVRCQKSRDAFAQQFAHENMDVSMFEKDMANGQWLSMVESCKQSFADGNFGDIKKYTGKNPQRELEFIMKADAPFYTKWHGPDADIPDIVLTQAAEYAAFAQTFSSTYEKYPLMQIAGDRLKMQIFNSFGASHPTICCKRSY